MSIVAALVLVLALLAAPASAAPISAPLEGAVAVGELRALLAAGPLAWVSDGDMVVAEYWDPEPGAAATTARAGYLLAVSETPWSTTAALTLEGLDRADCGRWQLDFEQRPLDGSTLKSLVIDTGVRCHESGSTPPVPVPELPAAALVVAGLVLLAARLRAWVPLAVLLALLPASARAEGPERPRPLVPLYAAAAGLQAYDLTLTHRALALGAREANPAFRPVAGSWPASAALKGATLGVTVYAAERLWRDGHPRLAVLALVASNALLVGVAWHNRGVVRRLKGAQW